MGFKKGRAARAAAQAAESSSKRSSTWHDDSSCVFFEAANGWTYKIDVLQMVQVNTSKGTTRNIHRHQGHGKNWSMWQYEAGRAEGRNYTHSKTTLVQYPKEVCIALEDRFKAARALAAKLEAEGPDAIDQQRAETRWRSKLERFDGKQLARVFQAAEVENIDVPGESSFNEEADASESVEPQELACRASSDAALREVLLERVLRQQRWSSELVAQALRWLTARGLLPAASHVRKAALLHGGLAPLQVLLVEAKVDVRGLPLLVDHRQAANANASSGGWVQRCKPALKALLARGAVLGSHTLQSRLLKRLEEDGTSCWTRSVLLGLSQDRPDLPETVLAKMAEFAGVSWQSSEGSEGSAAAASAGDDTD